MKTADKEDIITFDDEPDIEAIPCPVCGAILITSYGEDNIDNVEKCKICKEEFEII
ncbi:MAG: hypothetical protein GY714_18270 [Desulfobacterales bacterium]|nr:hypothetical protein [Desulfobacterales bacterium]